MKLGIFVYHFYERHFIVVASNFKVLFLYINIVYILVVICIVIIVFT